MNRLPIGASRAKRKIGEPGEWTVGCSQSPIFPWDFRDWYASVELPPSWFVKASSIRGESKLPRGAPSQGTLSQGKLSLVRVRWVVFRVRWASLGSLDTLPRLRFTKPRWWEFDRSVRISKIPRENRGLWTVESGPRYGGDFCLRLISHLGACSQATEKYGKSISAGF